MIRNPLKQEINLPANADFPPLPLLLRDSVKPTMKYYCFGLLNAGVLDIYDKVIAEVESTLLNVVLNYYTSRLYTDSQAQQ